ncbi:MAG: hypothetical protein JXA57_21005 [Armatimonadetes bacterium]|nr:hypothetical protein [Armatimonadota bacterium]
MTSLGLEPHRLAKGAHDIAGIEIPRETLDQNHNLSARVRDAVALETVGLRGCASPIPAMCGR